MPILPPLPRLIALLGLAPVAGGCTLLTGPRLDENYVLARYDNAPVPFQQSPMPPKGKDSFPNCWYTVAEGQLQFDEGNSSFRYAMVFSNSCSNRVLSSIFQSGTFVRAGSRLILSVPSQVGPTRTIEGEINGNAIILRTSSEVLQFERGPRLRILDECHHVVACVGRQVPIG